MRALVLCLLFASPALAGSRVIVQTGTGSVQVRGGAPVDPTVEVVEVDRAMQQLLRDQAGILAEIGELSASASNPAVLRLLHERLAIAEDLRRKLDGLRDRMLGLALRGRTVEVVREVPVEVVREVMVEAPVDPGPQPVGPGEFASIRDAVASESFRDDKLAMLSSATAGRWLLTGQVIELMGQFSFDDDKVEAAARLYPQVIDPESWFKVYSALTFSGSKDELRRRVGR